MEQELECIVRGKVQMVMFRDFVQRHARAASLRGFVRNLQDGTVHLIAQGERAPLERLLKKLSKGPLLARVELVSVRWNTPQEVFEGFSIRYD